MLALSLSPLPLLAHLHLETKTKAHVQTPGRAIANIKVLGFLHARFVLNIDDKKPLGGKPEMLDQNWI